METEKKYKLSFGIESTSDEIFGVEIFTLSPIALSDMDKNIIRETAETILERIKRSYKLSNPKDIENSNKETKMLLDCFPEGMRIFSEEVPNEYCRQSCCANKRWLIVTTSLGRIKIGPRKRVISIDWSDSTIIANANQLFHSEDVTKEGRLIHAWGYDEAKKYLEKMLVTSVPII